MVTVTHMKLNKTDFVYVIVSIFWYFGYFWYFGAPLGVPGGAPWGPHGEDPLGLLGLSGPEGLLAL